jgi:hypothetical protein
MWAPGLPDPLKYSNTHSDDNYTLNDGLCGFGGSNILNDDNCAQNENSE